MARKSKVESHSMRELIEQYIIENKLSNKNIAIRINALAEARDTGDVSITESAVRWHREHKINDIVSEVMHENKDRIEGIIADSLTILTDIMDMAKDPAMKATIKWSDILKATSEYERLFGGLSKNIGPVDLDVRWGKALTTPREIILAARKQSLEQLGLSETELQGIMDEPEEEDIFTEKDDEVDDDDFWNALQ